MSKRTEELLAATSLLDDLDKTRLELLDGRDMVGQDTHLTRLGWDIHLYAVVSSVWQFVAYPHIFLIHSYRYSAGRTYTSWDL